MRYILLFATLLIITGTACKKSKTEPIDLLPGNWELREEAFRTEPGTISYRFGADKSYTQTVNGVVQSGTFNAHYINDQKAIEVIFTTDQGNPAAVFYLEKVSANEFKHFVISAGPGPSTQKILLRVK